MFSFGTLTSVQLVSASSTCKLGSITVPLSSTVSTLLLGELMAYNDTESPEIAITLEGGLSIFAGWILVGTGVRSVTFRCADVADEALADVELAPRILGLAAGAGF